MTLTSMMTVCKLLTSPLRKHIKKTHTYINVKYKQGKNLKEKVENNKTSMH